jgi:hypothetical protein
VDGEFDAFDEIRFDARIYGRATFTNPNSGLSAGIPRPAGDPFTYPHRMLDADPGDIPGALGLVRTGLINEPRWLSFTVTDADGTIDTAPQPNGDLFLANLNLSSPALSGDLVVFTRVCLFSEGRIVNMLSDVLALDSPLPEPASSFLAVGALSGLVALPRNNRRKRHACVAAFSPSA